MTHPTADWKKLHDRYYAKRELYEMDWIDMELSAFMVAAAPYGGPIATIRDDSKMIQLTDSQLKPTVRIYTSAGVELAAFLWNHFKMIKMGWTDDERLVCVQEDGTVFLYTVHGVFISQFSMGRDVENARIIDAHVWGGGIVVMTTEYRLYTVSFDGEPRPRAMADPGLSERPTSWTIIEPQFTDSRSVEVLVGAASGTVLVVDAVSKQDMEIIGPFTRMAVSPNGQNLAMFSPSGKGKLWVVTTDFKKNLVGFETDSQKSPIQLIWCGADTVIMSFDKMLLMVGPHDNWIKYHTTGAVHLVTEVDGARVISNDTCELIRSIPDEVERIFKVGSIDPAAMLYEALDHFENKSPKADENIRAIKADLSDAVDWCVEAAGHEHDERLQKKLLRAASFGKSFLDMYSPDQFVLMCKTLRVLNAVRYYKVGIPLTYQQFLRLGPEGLVSRLVNRRQHLLAFRVCEYLQLPTERVLVHWACEKVKQSAQPEAELCRDIVEKLALSPGISCAEIADTAYRSGRPELATMLLDHEPRASDQVPLLLDMHEDELALVKAIESGDTDLVYLVILSIQSRMTTGDFFNIIRNKPLACDLFVLYCRSENHEMLKDYYDQADQSASSANVIVMDAYKCTDLQMRLGGLKVALSFYKEYKESQFEAKIVEEQITLLNFQMKLTRDSGVDFVDLSVSDTIFQCIARDMDDMASKVKSNFKVPDKRYWWIKVRALAHRGAWMELEKFSKAKKSPIGYEPFVDICLENRMLREAGKYIPRVTDVDKQNDYYFAVGMWKQAADGAFKRENVDLLRKILDNCRDRDVNNTVHTMIAKLEQ